MLAVAVVPSAPVLVPALAAGAAAEVAPLLAACDDAVGALVAHAPETVVCVGSGARTTRHRAGAWGTLAGFGVDVEAPAAGHAGLPHLPLSLTLGRWLLERVGWRGPVVAQEISVGMPAADCAVAGRLLATETGSRVAWLVIGDGSICRDERAPGYFDPRAAEFDAGTAAALRAGDSSALAGLDVRLATELGAAGRPGWQVLAGALAGRPVRTARLGYDAAPYGVGYFVASWSC